ncbi:hypothetical protein B0H17DRAFT_1203137 [Mycena rosella]|uniref:Uncharacterized protein n=1 Tax=Mycena rosella TaxID=1033263 RepID=A0AAD7DCM0_MYCRO|nr:hypothetical protein B0H17DRAFT_1203137 [Mycena rosella]
MSAFSGHYPYTAGPNDAPPIPLTPQQLALAYHHFQFMQQNTMPPPPPPPPQAPVIDPALQVRDPNTNTQRLEALESSLLKTTQKSDAYLLRDAKGLSVKQEEVRKQLMKKMKTELMTLTGMARDANSESNSDSESSSAPPARPSRSVMSFDFNQNIDHPMNTKVIDRAAELIWKEQHDPKADTFSLLHKDVKFTLADIASVGKTNFRTWKRSWKAETDTAAAAKRARQEAKGRQIMRKKDLKRNRLKALPEYKKRHKKNPAFILETDWMSDEISGPDTDDEAKKDIHRKLLVEAAKLTPEQESQPLWERVRPGFQTTEMTEIKDDLDGICEEQKLTQKKKSRPVVQRLNLGNLHSRIPAGTLWPFMIRQDWYDETLAVNAELESALSLYTKNPEGFGDELDDGYGGDDEGGHA